ncbi:MAG: 5-formyltetrahydrofolate cyclo-ligase [Alphaproteobacteria bacterium]|nr:MAG: 5-formyltetrahydrofolate cyclo-ligase [Alphaproteobacteria bacterium]
MKEKWRKQYRNQRRIFQETAPNLHKDYSLEIAKKLTQILPDEGLVASYLAFDAEVDLTWINASLMQQNRLLLPGVHDSYQALHFFHVTEKTAFKTSSHGMQEPKSTDNALWPDVVLVPLVAFGPTGVRLGFGKGHYDRTFSKVEKRPTLIGIGFSMSYCSALTSETHDIPLNMVVTEKRVHTY